MASVTSTLPDAHQALFSAKAKSGLTFQQLAEKMNRSEVWVAAVFYGQVNVSSPAAELQKEQNRRPRGWGAR